MNFNLYTPLYLIEDPALSGMGVQGHIQVGDILTVTLGT